MRASQGGSCSLVPNKIFPVFPCSLKVFMVEQIPATTEIAITDRSAFFFPKVVINLSIASIAFRAISTLANLLLLGSYGTVSAQM